LDQKNLFDTAKSNSENIIPSTVSSVAVGSDAVEHNSNGGEGRELNINTLAESISHPKSTIVSPSKPKVEEGDIVILYADGEFQLIQVKRGSSIKINMRKKVLHDDLIGEAYGSQFAEGVYLLAPTADLWSLSLLHRTQILYSTDISLIVFHLELRPGSIVVESGTGSTSLTAALGKAVFPKGKVFTFDFHAERADAARKDLNSLGLNEQVVVTHRDVLEGGFEVESHLGEGQADALFLDLPTPWPAIAHAHKVLKRQGIFCSFSPCIEQVQQTTSTLRKSNFAEITTIECLARPYEVISEVIHDWQQDIVKKRKRNDGDSNTQNTKETMLVTRPERDIRGHTGYLTFARKIK